MDCVTWATAVTLVDKPQDATQSLLWNQDPTIRIVNIMYMSFSLSGI